MWKKNKQSEVTRYEPPQGEAQPPAAPQQGQIYRMDPQTGNMIPVQDQSQFPMGMPAAKPGHDDYIFDGRQMKRTNPDGSVTYMEVGNIVRQYTKAAPVVGEYDPSKDGFISKKRVIIGGLFALLLLMLMADVMGVPHVRTSPGVYVSLEGEKVVEDKDRALLTLIRLDHSVFLYAKDAVAWCFTTVAGMISSDDAASDN